MPATTRDLHGSHTIKRQARTFEATYTEETTGFVRTFRVRATVRWDDQCGNGHNTFGITGEIQAKVTRHGIRRWETIAFGCLHDDIAHRIPELAPLLKWHLCGGNGPLHYIANTVHHAGDRDCWGFRAGEFRQSINAATGLPLWEPDVPPEWKPWHSGTPSTTRPEFTPVGWKPMGRTGAGKARDLDAARRAAIWPDATDDELVAPGLEGRLIARLPALMAEFRSAVESLGFTW